MLQNILFPDAETVYPDDRLMFEKSFEVEILTMNQWTEDGEESSDDVIIVH